jgi:hypothetical protein
MDVIGLIAGVGALEKTVKLLVQWVGKFADKDRADRSDLQDALGLVSALEAALQRTRDLAGALEAYTALSLQVDRALDPCVRLHEYAKANEGQLKSIESQEWVPISSFFDVTSAAADNAFGDIEARKDDLDPVDFGRVGDAIEGFKQHRTSVGTLVRVKHSEDLKANLWEMRSDCARIARILRGRMQEIMNALRKLGVK